MIGWTEKEIFTKEFLKLDYHHISHEIKKNGFFCFDKALNNSFLDSIEKDVKKSGISLNTNGIAGVYYSPGKQFFLTHMLAVSKSFFNYCTSQVFLNICSNYLGDKFRLKAIRYYENYGGQKMQWHTDNKTGEEFTDIPGLIFIAYVSDVFDGEFQYIKGSHLWSVNQRYNDYTEKFVNKSYSDSIISFKKPKGSLIVYNAYGVHRAKPSKNKKFIRKSLFIQVDKEMNASTPILINTEFADSLDEKIKMFLGFGLKSGYDTFPSTSIKSMPLSINLMSTLLKWIFYRFLLNLIYHLPGFFRKKFRKIEKFF